MTIVSPRPNAQQPLDLSILNRTPLDPYNSQEQDQEVETLYVNWSNSGKSIPPPYNPSEPPLNSQSDPWASKAAAAWLLSQRLSDRDFERYTLAHLILHCGTALFGPWAFIEARCPTGSSIRRFTNHWVAWNASFLPPGSRSEYTGLYASTLVNRVVRNETHDPRTFDLDHWFHACGDAFVADKCDHDPAVVRAKERLRNRPPTSEPSHVGRGEELGIDTWGLSWKLSSLSVRFSRKLTGRTWKPLRWCARTLVPFLLAHPLGCSVAFFLLNLIMAGILAGIQLGSGVFQETPGVRRSNVRFTMAVVLVGVGQLIFSFYPWRRWFVYYVAVFNLWAFANGVTWAVDGRSCTQFLGEAKCPQVTASAAFVLLCIPFSTAHMVFVRKCNRRRQTQTWNGV